ncbi:MAG: DNA-binding protein [Candidatus Omnitrophica bacterium]|nr:DNA-binding protein [Candidatus Omnitrophota bacterium]
MKKILFIFCFIGILILSHAVFAQSLTVKDLIQDGMSYDGKRIAIDAEVIGHLMKRGDFAWFNINDGTKAIGVWTTFDLTKDIKYLGKHSVVGDTVRVEGVFHLRCPGHGGDTDIHADSITILERGKTRHLTYDSKKINILIFLIVILTCLYIIKILKRMR